VLDIQNGKILRLNITGSLIFERLQQGQSELQIIRAISRDFGIPEDTTKRDVGEFLQSLAQQRLLIGESMEKHS